MRPILKHDTIFYPCGYLSKLLRKTVCVGLIFTGGFFIVRWLATHCTLAVDSNTPHNCSGLVPTALPQHSTLRLYMNVLLA
jgi:hypothetical protein